jgi:CRP-like cAMP-binding protein
VQDASGDAKGTKAVMLELGVLEKGSVFGLSGLFHELRQRWQCKADTPLQLYAVPHDLFLRCDARVVAAVREQAAFRQAYFLGRRGMLDRPPSPPVVSLNEPG